MPLSIVPNPDDARRGPSPGVKFIRVPQPYRMYRGGSLPQFTIAYEAWGPPLSACGEVVLLFTGLSMPTHVARSQADPSPGWWDYIVGPGGPIDTRRYSVVCVNALGGCFGSTGPSSTNPATGQPYRLAFPALCVEDIAATARLALHALGVRRVHAVVGASLGGMAALAYAVMFPGELDRLVTISAAARATPFAIALRSLQRELIRQDSAWAGGNYPLDAGPIEGLRLARKLGLTSYRSAAEWQERFGRRRIDSVGVSPAAFEAEFEIEAYLERHAARFAAEYDANSYLYLSRAMDWFDLSEHGESEQAALGRVRVRDTLVIGVETDFLFPIWQQEQIAKTLDGLGQRVSFARLASLQGHDAFLVDEQRFAPIVRRFFSED